MTFVVPTGNFGDTLAGYYAQAMGLPVKKFVVATNENDILHRFLSQGDFTPRPVQSTLAPAMDIVVPSNFERYLFHLLDNNPVALKHMLEQYEQTGQLDLGPNRVKLMAQAKATFHSSRASDAEITATMNSFKQRCSYNLCPHTATGLFVHSTLPDPSRCIFLATAHPAKFMKGPLEGISIAPAVPAYMLDLHCKPKRCVHLPNDRFVSSFFTS